MADAEPGPSAARREYRQLQSRDELDTGWPRVPAEAPVAVAVGEMMSETVVGLAARNEACSVALGTHFRNGRQWRTTSRPSSGDSASVRT